MTQRDVFGVLRSTSRQMQSLLNDQDLIKRDSVVGVKKLRGEKLNYKLACVASVPELGPREGVFAFGRREKWGESKKVEGAGWGRGKKGNVQYFENYRSLKGYKST